MPGGDRTGPSGLGPMTGRSAGYCAGFQAPGFSNAFKRAGYGYGMRGGRGGGRGHRHWFYATGLTGRQRAMYGYPFQGYYRESVTSVSPFNLAITREHEADMLKGQVEYMEESLSSMKKRLQALESERKK